jgi:hypothetical protein
MAKHSRSSLDEGVAQGNQPQKAESPQHLLFPV